MPLLLLWVGRAVQLSEKEVKNVRILNITDLYRSYPLPGTLTAPGIKQTPLSLIGTLFKASSKELRSLSRDPQPSKCLVTSKGAPTKLCSTMVTLLNRHVPLFLELATPPTRPDTSLRWLV